MNRLKQIIIVNSNHYKRKTLKKNKNSLIILQYIL